MSETDITPSLIVLRYGELFLKGANRGQFESILQRNVKRAMQGLDGVRLERGQGRLFVNCQGAGADAALGRLARVFGLSSLSPAQEVPQQLEAVSQAALQQVQAVLERREVRSFRVTAKRADKDFSPGSPEINRLVGAHVVQHTGLAVDLHNPELVVGVEIGPQRSFVFTERLPGAGGLPVGASARVALLLSGGIDSPVAGHLMQKRGCQLEAIYFHSFPYTSERSQAKVQQLAERLAPAQGALKLHVVPFTAVQTAVRDKAPRELAVVLYRRSMMRIACALAARLRCPALATGENLGQVASQTLENLACIQHVADRPVLRPLLTYDKLETIAVAYRIGTYELSIQPYDDCCSLFVPRHPATRANPRTAARAEAEAELEPLEAAAVEQTVVVECGC